MLKLLHQIILVARLKQNQITQNFSHLYFFETIKF